MRANYMREHVGKNKEMVEIKRENQESKLDFGIIGVPEGQRERKSNNKWENKMFLNWGVSVPLFAIPWTVAFEAPLSMGFSKQEYWSGLPCPPPGFRPTDRIHVSCISYMDRHVLYHWLHLGLDKKAIITIQEARIGTFLAVQWLRLRASTAEGTVQSLVVELRSCKPYSVAKKKNFGGWSQKKQNLGRGVVSLGVGVKDGWYYAVYRLVRVWGKSEQERSLQLFNLEAIIKRYRLIHDSWALSWEIRKIESK